MIPHLPNNPLLIAKEAQDMARNAKGGDGQMFQKVALVSICVMAAASASHVLLSLWKELSHKHGGEREQGRGR